MFEKSKSAITFKEFQDKLNIVNNFESDWGHFCYIDYNEDDKNENSNINIKNINNINIKKNNSNNLLKSKIIKTQPVFKKIYFVDIEKLEKKNKKEVPKTEYNDESKYNNENETAITIIRGCLTAIQITFITIVMGYFIFKVI